jgi:hypothetical protein
MDTSKIKEIAKRAAVEHFSNPDVLKELCTPDMSAQFCWGSDFEGREEIIALLKKYVSDPRVVIDDCFGEHDRVVMRFRAVFPLEEGKEVIRNEISILRFEGEKNAEWWAAFDRQYEEDQRRRT